MEQQFSLRWNNYLNQITDAFGSLREEEDLVDVTLSCEGKKLKAHKMLLSACSTYFRDIFKENPCQHPVIVFQNVKFKALEAIIHFIYRGQVNVMQDQLDSFLSTAELLEVKGLTDGSGKENNFEEEENKVIPTPTKQQETVSEATKQTERSSVGPINQPPVSFIPVSPRPSSPPQKKKKYNTISVKLPESKQGPVVSEVVNLMVVPKIEKQEYIEDLTFDEDEDVDLPHTPSPETLQTLLRNSKQDNSVEFNTNSNSSQDQQDNMIAMGQMLLGEPGTSVEAVSQESMQAEDTIDCMAEEVVDDDEETSNKIESSKENPSESHIIAKVDSNELNQSQRSWSISLKKKFIKTPFSQGSKTEFEKRKEINQEIKKKMTEVLAKVAKLEATGVGIHLPKGLTVQTSIKDHSEVVITSQDEHIEDSCVIQLAEDNTTLKAEEAKTRILEEFGDPQIHMNQQPEVSNISSETCQVRQIDKDLEVGEEVSALDPPQEDDIEPEFDYYGCDICKAEARSVDKFNFTQKCPICPCMCFCSHLLKQHMKHIHGWFNVRRSFTQY